MDEYSVGEYIIYQNGEKYELGRIKSLREDGAFVAYHEAETGALTPYDHMHKLINRYCIKDTSLGGDYFKADTPQTEESCERCVYVRGSQWCQGCNGTPKRWDGEKIADTPQTDCELAYLGNEYCEACKYGQDISKELYICNKCGVGINNYTPQTDCGWK